MPCSSTNTWWPGIACSQTYCVPILTCAYLVTLVNTTAITHYYQKWAIMPVSHACRITGPPCSGLSMPICKPAMAQLLCGDIVACTGLFTRLLCSRASIWWLRRTCIHVCCVPEPVDWWPRDTRSHTYIFSATPQDTMDMPGHIASMFQLHQLVTWALLFAHLPRPTVVMG